VKVVEGLYLLHWLFLYLFLLLEIGIQVIEDARIQPFALAYGRLPVHSFVPSTSPFLNGSVLGIDMDLFTIENFMDQISLIYDATKDKKSISVAWIDANTRDFFYTTEVIEEYRDKHRVLDRFRPNLQLPVFEMDSVPNPDAIALNENGFIYKKNHLKWIEKFSIRELLWQEIDTLRFHLRKDTIKDMGDLGNGYFSLASQLLMADSLT
jgi:hypothetical protein